MTDILITPTKQEWSLIAMLYIFEAVRKVDENETNQITIKIHHGQWVVDLMKNPYFKIAGNGASFSIAWDAMVKNVDEWQKAEWGSQEIDTEDNENDLILSSLIQTCLCREMTLTAQERSLLNILRRRAALRDDYTIFIEVNSEERPGEWEISELTTVNGVGDTFATAWSERF